MKDVNEVINQDLLEIQYLKEQIYNVISDNGFLIDLDNISHTAICALIEVGIELDLNMFKLVVNKYIVDSGVS